MGFGLVEGAGTRLAGGWIHGVGEVGTDRTYQGTGLGVREVRRALHLLWGFTGRGTHKWVLIGPKPGWQQIPRKASCPTSELHRHPLACWKERIRNHRAQKTREGAEPSQLLSLSEALFSWKLD